MTREDAIKLGTFSKASSVARLVKATPAAETVAEAIRDGVMVGGRRLDVQGRPSYDLPSTKNICEVGANGARAKSNAANAAPSTPKRGW